MSVGSTFEIDNTRINNTVRSGIVVDIVDNIYYFLFGDSGDGHSLFDHELEWSRFTVLIQ